MERQLSEPGFKTDLGEKLGQMHSIQQLQEEVINYRNNEKLLRKIMKQTCIAELKKLQAIEISIAGNELKLLTPEQWPKCDEVEINHFDPDAVLRDIENTAQAMDLLK